MQSIDNYRYRIEAVLAARIPRTKDKGIGTPWMLHARRQTAHSFEYAYRVPTGYSVIDVEKQIDAFFAACGAIVELEDRAGIVIFRVYPEDFPVRIQFKESMLQLVEGERDLLLGFNRRQEPVIHSLAGNPHLLIGGMSGYGKTDLLRLLVYQLARRMTSEQLEIVIIDMKGFSFLPFGRLPHITRVARDLPGAYEVLQYAVTEMLAREQSVWESGDRRIIESFRQLVVLIDEAAQIAPKMYSSRPDRQLAGACDELCAKLATKGREPKVSLIYATQRPDHEVINGQVKANMDAAIALRTKTAVNSQIILDRPGAERLPAKVPGRAIYSTSIDVTIQIPYVGGDDAWSALLEPLRTEVIYAGQSQRREDQTGAIHTIHHPSDDNGAGGADDVSGVGKSPQAGFSISPGARGGKDRGRAQAGGHAEGVAPDTSRTGRSADRQGRRPPELPEDRSLVDDW